MFVNRNYGRTEHDDFVLNVEPKLDSTSEAIPQYVDENIVGWKIQNRFD